MRRSADKVAAVTGGSAGIGKAICEDLLAQGYEVSRSRRRPRDIDHPKLHSIEVDLPIAPPPRRRARDAQRFE
jgi:NAD(P)-dependent dehydrogenase (short-subunit alcohol dehydrogenase family)